MMCSAAQRLNNAVEHHPQYHPPPIRRPTRLRAALLFDNQNSYADGALVHTLSATGAIGDAVPAQNELRAGGRQAVGQHFQGRIDEVRVYGSALAAGDVAELAVASGNVRWLVTDHLGTPRMVVDLSGELDKIKRHDYLPFGEEIGAGVGGRMAGQGYVADNVRQGFGKYEKDIETGLDYAKARYYGPTMGRFTSPDPLLASGKSTQPQSWNRYSYCINNPLKYIDPTGLIWGQKDGRVRWYNNDDWNAAQKDGWTEQELSYVASNNRWVHLNSNGPNANATTAEGRAGFKWGPSANEAGVETQYGHMMMGTGVAQAGGQLFSGLIRNAVSSFFGRGAATEGISVASGIGGEAGEMTIVRTIGRGEKLADIINQGKSLTFETGNEHALVTLASNGQRALVSGSPYGIRFGDQVTRIFGHSHPYQFTNTVGASAVDRAAIQALGQRSSWLAERGAGGIFGVQKFTIGK